MSKARDIASAAPAPAGVTSTELGYVDGVTSAIQTQIDSKIGQATAINPTIVDAKGDIIAATAADTVSRLAVGSNNQVLTADSSTATGLKWATADALPSQTDNSGKYLTTNGTTASWGTVNQPTTWTQRTAFSNSVITIAYNGSNLYAAGGSNGLIATSSDGITWTSRTSNFGSNEVLKIAFGNGLFVAVGENGTITTSTDGITWTARTSNMGTNTIRDVIYANSIWVAVGNGGGTNNTGGITYSTDGITWTRKSQSLTIGSTYYAVIWNGTNWIVGANNATNNYLYASAPSGTWTVGSSGSVLDILDLFYDGTRTLEVTSNGNLRYSTSATLGTTTQISGANMQTGDNRNFYYNGNIYSIGSFLVVYSTTPQGTSNNIHKTISTSLSPTTRNDSSGGVSNGASTIFVNSTGTIAGGVSGSIFTSF